ncbi:MAG: transposase, partial [Bacteroidetes bacterium]|nr:transposase [Bacteroidota bacterium]
NIRLLYLPSSNPELNPVERLWEDMKAKVAFHNFKDEQQLEEWIKQTAKAYHKQQIASLTGFPYIIDAIDKVIASMEGAF